LGVVVVGAEPAWLWRTILSLIGILLHLECRPSNRFARSEWPHLPAGARPRTTPSLCCGRADVSSRIRPEPHRSLSNPQLGVKQRVWSHGWSGHPSINRGEANEPRSFGRSDTAFQPGLMCGRGHRCTDLHWFTRPGYSPIVCCMRGLLCACRRPCFRHLLRSGPQHRA
jgi:hypothetical protein